MNDKQQTAVEQFIEQLEEKGDVWENASMKRIEISIKVEDYLKLINQAKEIEKERIIKSYNQGYRDGGHDASNIPLSIGDISEYNNAENYYNETYGGNK